jgi:hypothetical protein
MAIEYIRDLCQLNGFAKGEFPVFGRPVTLAEVKVPLCAIACETDHIAHWRGSFNGIKQMGSKDKTFIVSQSGHIAGIINPPSKGKYGHYTSDAPLEGEPDDWMKGQPSIRAAGGRVGGPGWPNAQARRFRPGSPVIRAFPNCGRPPAPMWSQAPKVDLLGLSAGEACHLSALQKFHLKCCTAACICQVIRKRATPDHSGAIEMTKTTDFTKVMQDMMASFPVDASAFQNAFKTQAAFGEKMAESGSGSC